MQSSAASVACYQVVQACCVSADALKEKFLHRHHLDLHPTGPGVVSLHDVQEQVSHRKFPSKPLQL